MAEVFADTARQLEAETSPERTQSRVTEAALLTVDGCDHAASSIIGQRGGIEMVAATDDVPPRVDAIQYDSGQGPGLRAISEHVTYVIDDLAGDDRWPAFSRRVVEETGVRSMLSFRLFVQGDTMGVLSLYSRRPGGQLLDYGPFVDSKRSAVVVPTRPRDDLLAFLAAAGVTAIYP